MPETWDGEGSQESIGKTLAETPRSGVIQPEVSTPVARQDPQWRDKGKTLPTKFTTPQKIKNKNKTKKTKLTAKNFSFLQEIQGQRWSRD